MRVIIDSGPPTATDRPIDIPKKKWFSLMQEKRSFLHINIKYDCRCLLEFIEDAEEMWDELGFTSRDDLIVNGYELDPSEVNLAAQWLKIKDPGAEVPFDVAIQEAREMPLITKAEAGAKGGRGNKANKELNSFAVKKGPTAQYHLRRIARDKPELLDEIEAGSITLAEAKKIAGIKENPKVSIGNPETVARAIFNKKGVDYVESLVEGLKAYVPTDPPLWTEEESEEAFLATHHIVPEGQESTRQAAIACGIIKIKTPLEQILTMAKRLSTEEMIHARDCLDEAISTKKLEEI